MRFTEFRDGVFAALRAAPGGLTWRELRERARLPCETPCPNWVGRLEKEGLTRTRGEGRAYVWRVPAKRAR